LVYEGNALTTDFELETNSGEWIDNWTLEPGEAGAAAGTKSDSVRVSISIRESSLKTEILNSDLILYV
jgi:hypothetical protein